MKLALLIYGHMRTYKKCYENLKKNLLNLYDIDVFIHTWDVIEAATRSWHNRHMEKLPLTEELFEEIKNIYNPISIETGTQEKIYNDVTLPGSALSYAGHKYMMISQNNVTEQKIKYEKENNFKYDAVIKIRPDIRLLKPLQFELPDDKTVLIAGNIVGQVSNDPNKISQNVDKYRACDIINIATSENMNKLCCGLHNSFEKYFVEITRNGTVRHSAFIDYVWDIGLNIKFLYYNYNRGWTIIRKEGR